MRLVVLVAAALASAVTPSQAQDAQGAAAKPLSLVEALDFAERESESVGIARSDLSRAEGERRRARSSYFPQLTGSASYTRTLRSQFSALAHHHDDARADRGDDSSSDRTR